MKAIKDASVSDDEVRVLLDRYKCPVPFHQVRTRFLGNIASPVMSASPIETVRGLWGGELPQFDDINAANELIGALVMGLGPVAELVGIEGGVVSGVFNLE